MHQALLLLLQLADRRLQWQGLLLRLLGPWPRACQRHLRCCQHSLVCLLLRLCMQLLLLRLLLSLLLCMRMQLLQLLH